MDEVTSEATDAAHPYPIEISREDRRMLAAIGDPVALAILSALGIGERDGHSLVVETGLPQSSIYRKLRELQDGHLVYVCRLAFTRDGHKVELFRSRLREVHVDFGGSHPRVRAVVREDSADRIQGLWTEVRRSAR